MAEIDRLIDNKWIQNLFIWFCLFLILMGTIHAESKALAALFVILLLAPVIYINNLLILPFFNKNTFRFFILFFINVLVFTFISTLLVNQAVGQGSQWNMFLSLMGVIILAVTFGSAIKISRDSFIRRQEAKNAELKLLKAQLNPHFLFNTLNNLYGLSVVKSDKLPGLMLQLSDLLRYSLYDTKETFVPLVKEIQYLENYISLEKIRLEDQTDISFTISGNIQQQMIAPMLLIVFVENAFKHLGNLMNTKSKVAIDLIIHKHSLQFTCFNSIDRQPIEESLEKGKSGIGLENAKKRLDFLYPSKHKIDITKNQENYSVELTIDF